MGFSFTASTHSRHSPHTLFTAHAPRTHVKAPQTDLPAKPDNSSGPTHDSPSERLLRTKVTFQHKTAPKKHREHQAVRGAPKPSLDQLSSMPHSDRESEPRPEGQHRNPGDIPPRCSEPWTKPRRHQVRLHGSYRSGHLSLRGSATIGLGSRSLGIGIRSPPDAQCGSQRSRLT